MVWPGPSSLARRTAPAMLMPDEPPRHRPFVLEQVEDDRHRFLVGNLIGDVDRRAFEIFGDAALADAFGDRGAFGFQRAGRVIAVERGAHRIGERDAHRLVARLERDARCRRACRRCRRRRRSRRPCRRSAARFPARSSRCGPGGWRHCRTGWPRSRRSSRSWPVARRAGRRASRNCSDWNRARPAPRPVRRRTAAACPSSPGSAFPG